MNHNMNLYNKILNNDFENTSLEEIDMICREIKMETNEYDDLIKKIKNHRSRANIDISGNCVCYGSTEKNEIYDDNFILNFEQALNSDLLKSIFEILRQKNFEYDLSRIGVKNYGWADEQLFIQSLLLEKIYQYMIINRNNIQSEVFVSEYYNYLIKCCIDSNSFDELLRKCDSILLRSIVKDDGNISDFQKKKIILNSINTKFIDNGYCFHGFNSNFEDSILKYGLSGELNCCDVERMKIIDNILRNNGVINSFQQNWNYQLQPNFFTTDNFGASYYYSVLSPVYVSRLVSNGKYMADENQYDRTAFFDGNIRSCMNNIKLLLSQYDVPICEQEKIENYINSILQNVFCERNNMKVAFMKRKNIDRDFSINYDKALIMKNVLSPCDLLLLSLKPSFEIDRHQNTTYSPNIITTVDIPNFAKKLIKKRS